MKLSTLIFLAIIFPIWGLAQFSISGTVTDKESGKTLPGAHIIIDETFLSTSTGPDGAFVFKKLKPGNHSVKVSFVGYKAIVRKQYWTGFTLYNADDPLSCYNI